MKPSTLKYGSVALMFVALFFVPELIRQFTDQTDRAQASAEESLERYGFFMEEVSQELGVTFVHQRCDVDDPLKHIQPQIAAMGASVSVADVNNDGYQDFYVTNSAFGEPNHLYIQQSDGTFEEQASFYGVADLNQYPKGSSMGSIWADVNNDGWEDLFVYRYGKPVLFVNQKGQKFEPFEGATQFPDWVNSNSAVWLDYNADGYVDLFLTGYFKEDVDIWDLDDTRMMPDSYEFATNGGKNYLFRNDGGRGFTDVTQEMGLDNRKWTLAVTSVDINGSGFPDLILANDYGVDELFLNEKGKRFVDMGPASSMGDIPKSGMSITAADFYNQGDFALYVTNISEAGVLMQGNNLWAPTGSTTIDGIEVPTYANTATSAGVEQGEWAYSGAVTDLNNNGTLDLYIANGFYSATPNTDYWYDYTKVVGANSQVIINASNWPAMKERTFSGYQQNRLMLNDGSGRFREVSSAVGAALDKDSRAVAFLDIRNDGTMDMVVANQHAPVSVFKNQVNQDHAWIQISLEGTQANRSAIGASVTVEWTDAQGQAQRQKQSVSGGEAFSSQSSRVLHFGLGVMDSDTVENVTINWPGGKRDIYEAVPHNQKHTLQESTSARFDN